MCVCEVRRFQYDPCVLLRYVSDLLRLYYWLLWRTSRASSFLLKVQFIASNNVVCGLLGLPGNACRWGRGQAGLFTPLLNYKSVRGDARTWRRGLTQHVRERGRLYICAAYIGHRAVLREETILIWCQGVFFCRDERGWKILRWISTILRSVFYEFYGVGSSINNIPSSYLD